MTVETRRIDVRELTKSFGGVNTVDHLSFSVEPGSITGFLGRNGAGKTTTLRILLGLVSADSGSATIGGRAYAQLPVPNDEVGAVLEASGFHPARSGRAHLRAYCTVNGYPARRADEVLDLVGLSDAGRRPAGTYSLGMRQRLALATALLGNPSVLVLDEPTNGLDPDGIAWMRRFLRALAAEGRTVLISSHVLAEMQQLVDHVVIIDRGRCVRQGSLAELMRLRQPAVVARTPQPDVLHAALATDPVAQVDRVGPEELRIRGLEPTQVGDRAYDAGVRLHGLHAEHGDLEDLFFAMTTPGGQAPTYAEAGG